MPYIITPGIQTTDSGTNYDSVAVVTIDEARTIVTKIGLANALLADNYDDLRVQFANLRDQGGTIGPMPDGYVIDVRFVSYGQLWQVTTGSKADQPVDTAEIIDAFNGA